MTKVKIFVAILVTAAICFVAYANTDSKLYQAGNYLGEYLDKTDSSNSFLEVSSEEEIAAIYHDRAISTSTIDYQREMILLSDENLNNITDYEVVNRIVKGYMMVEEAERLGVEATQEEIAATVQMSREAYNTYEETRKVLDEYCDGAGITIDEYFQLMMDDAYSSISRQKLKDEIGKQYCDENGLEFTKFNPPQEMMDAIDAYLEDLFNQYKDEIVYYVDVVE